MADSKERLDAMKNYCDKAIMVERELNFWNGLINQANQKLSQYRNEQLRLKKVMSEAQTQLASLGFMSQQKIGEKQAEIQKYKRKCRKSAIVFFRDSACRCYYYWDCGNRFNGIWSDTTIRTGNIFNIFNVFGYTLWFIYSSYHLYRYLCA